MTGAALVWHQFRYDQKAFWRNPPSVFFTVLFPLIFLVLFGGLFGNNTVTVAGQQVSFTTYYVPGIVALAVISATLVNLAISLTVLRESGQLKRLRGTPLAPWVFIAGRIGNALVVAVLMVIVVSAIGAAFYDVTIPWARMDQVALALLVGVPSFCCLGLAMTTIIPNQDAAPAITNATVLPLYFLSGIFVPDDEIPDGILHIASVFPIRHFFLNLRDAWIGGGVDWVSLLIVAAWGVAGALIAARFFRWSPS